MFGMAAAVILSADPTKPQASTAIRSSNLQPCLCNADAIAPVRTNHWRRRMNCLSTQMAFQCVQRYMGCINRYSIAYMYIIL